MCDECRKYGVGAPAPETLSAEEAERARADVKRLLPFLQEAIDNGELQLRPVYAPQSSRRRG